MEVMKKAKPQDIVYHYVKNQIVGKSMFPGNRIIEDDIIRETGTSRTSIRPALLRLKYEGLVEMIPNRGAFVAKPSEEDLRQVYRVREVLECGMMEDAIRHRTEAQLRAMETAMALAGNQGVEVIPLPELVEKVAVVQTVSDELWEQAKRLLRDHHL